MCQGTTFSEILLCVLYRARLILPYRQSYIVNKLYKISYIYYSFCGKNSTKRGIFFDILVKFVHLLVLFCYIYLVIE